MYQVLEVYLGIQETLKLEKISTLDSFKRRAMAKETWPK